MEYVSYSLLIVGIYFSMGIGLTALLVPTMMSKISIYIAPFVGLCTVELISWYLYNYGMRGTDSYAMLVFIALCSLSVVTMLSSKLRGRFVFEISEVSIAYIIACLGFFCVSITVLMQPSSLTTISYGNNDIAYVSSISKFLKEFRRDDHIGLLGQYGVFRYLADDSLFGAPVATAFLCSIFGRHVYEIQTAHLSVLFFFTIPLVYAFSSEIFQYRMKSAFLLEAFFAVNPLIHHILLRGFQAQVLTMGMACCIIFISLKLFLNSHSLMTYARYLPLFVLFSWGISISYGHMLPIVYGVIFGVLFCQWFVTGNLVQVLRWFGFFLVSMVLLTMLSPHRANVLLTLTSFMGRVEAGWFVRLLTPAAFFGYDTKPLFNTGAGVIWAREVVPFGFCILALLGYWRAFKERKPLAVAGSSILAVVGLGYLILGYDGRLDSWWGGYKSFKLLTFFLPSLIICCLVGIDEISVKIREHSFKISMIIFPLIFIGCIINIASNLRHYRHSYTVNSSLVDIAKISDMDQIESINIMGSNFWQIMWSAHFLMKKKVYFEVSSYAGLFASELVGEWDLFPVGLAGKFLYSENDTQLVYINDDYVLRRRHISTEDASFSFSREYPEHTNIYLSRNNPAPLI